MCAFWDKWLKKETPVRTITRPNQLNPGDLVQLDDSFGLPEDIRGASYTVESVGTYQFEHEQSAAWTLKGAQGVLSLSVDSDAGSETICLSKGLSKTEVIQWFDEDQFAQVFEEDYELRLEPLKQEGEFASWVSGRYLLKTFAQPGYYYEQDYRGRQAPQYEGSGQPFDYYCLVNEEETHAVEIEVYQDGTTEVSVSKYLDVATIKDMWPGT